METTLAAILVWALVAGGRPREQTEDDAPPPTPPRDDGPRDDGLPGSVVNIADKTLKTFGPVAPIVGGVVASVGGGVIVASAWLASIVAAIVVPRLMAPAMEWRALRNAALTGGPEGLPVRHGRAMEVSLVAEAVAALPRDAVARPPLRLPWGITVEQPPRPGWMPIRWRDMRYDARWGELTMYGDTVTWWPAQAGEPPSPESDWYGWLAALRRASGVLTPDEVSAARACRLAARRHAEGYMAGVAAVATVADKRSYQPVSIADADMGPSPLAGAEVTGAGPADVAERAWATGIALGVSQAAQRAYGFGGKDMLEDRRAAASAIASATGGVAVGTVIAWGDARVDVGGAS